MYATRQHEGQTSRTLQQLEGKRVQYFQVDNNLENAAVQKENMNIIQKSHDLKCTTVIDYRHDGSAMQSIGYGENDYNDKERVINDIKKHPQTDWIGHLDKIANSNSPGQCAEPHSLADALLPIQETDKITKINQSPAIFRNDYFDYKKLQGRNNSEKRKKAKEMGFRVFGENKKYRGDTYPACDTCKQWVGNLSYCLNIPLQSEADDYNIEFFRGENMYNTSLWPE